MLDKAVICVDSNSKWAKSVGSKCLGHVFASSRVLLSLEVPDPKDFHNSFPPFFVFLGDVPVPQNIRSCRYLHFEEKEPWMDDDIERFVREFRFRIVARYRPILLIDIDNTMTNFSDAFEHEWSKRHPGIPIDRSVYNLRDAVKTHFEEDAITKVEEDICAIMCTPRIFADQPPIEGSVETYHRLVDLGFEVKICSTPWPTCVQSYTDKAEWCDRHLGQHKNLVLTNDKTIIRADLLIDDHPNIFGSASPQWTQILFHRPYNASVPDAPRIVDWKDAERVVLETLFGFPPTNV
jgi:5'-nucleotidase